MNKNIRQTVFPILAALIWGTSFVYQDTASKIVGAFTFNFARSVIAVVFLSLLSFSIDTYKQKKLKTKVETNYKFLAISGIMCGLLLFFACNLQQLGIQKGTSGGKAGFITAIYMIIVPIIGLFMKKKVGIIIWFSAIISLFGLYLLCVNGGFKVQSSDLFVLACALCYAFHIIVIDHFSDKVDGVKLSLLQFAVVMILSGICTLIFERATFSNLRYCYWQVIFVGLLSSGIAYTLQIVAQKGTNPTVVSVLLSLESFFAVVAEAIILKHKMTIKEYIGCAIILIAVMLTQIPFSELHKKKTNNTIE